MKSLLTAFLILTASGSVFAQWDGTGFYGTKEDAAKNLENTYQTDGSSKRIKIYEEVPKTISSATNACTIHNYSSEMSGAASATLTPKTAVVAYETYTVTGYYVGEWKPQHFLLFPAKESVIYSVDVSNPINCKVTVLKQSSSNPPVPSTPKNRVKLTSKESSQVQESGSVQVGYHYVTFTVKPELSTGIFGDVKLDGTPISLTGAGLCNTFLKENKEPYSNVIGFRTSICKDFKEFGYKGTYDGDSCIQIVRAKSAQAAEAYYSNDQYVRKASELDVLLSSSVFSATKLADILKKGQCF